MRSFLQAIRLYTLATWVGGLLFFAFTLAPTAFHNLPAHQAGLLVGATLPILHRTGIVCGLLFLLATGLGHPRDRPRPWPQRLLVLLMLALTVYIQQAILPAMERDRALAGGDITAAAPDNPARLHFDRLHKQSEQIEGGVLLLGLAVIALIATEARPERSAAA